MKVNVSLKESEYFIQLNEYCIRKNAYYNMKILQCECVGVKRLTGREVATVP